MIEQAADSRDIHPRIVDWIDAGRAFAVAVVLRTEGSAPRKAGAKALIDAHGAIWGTIGGGSVEAEAQRRAVAAIRTRRPEVFEFELQGAAPGDEEPICGGRMWVLVDPTAAANRAAYAQAVEALKQRRRGVLITRVRSGAPPEVLVEWRAEAEELSPERAAPLTIDAERGEMLVEPLIPHPLLLIVGGGHVSQALARQACLVGFDLAVIDDRPEFTDPALFPAGAAMRCGGIAREVAAFPIASDTYVVIVTRGHRHDAAALAACIRRPAAYVGMIGSRRKIALLRKHFIESGRATEQEFDRVFAPVGLDIGSETVPEIAASIVAQLIAVRRTGAADRIRL